MNPVYHLAQRSVDQFREKVYDAVSAYASELVEGGIWHYVARPVGTQLRVQIRLPAWAQTANEVALSIWDGVAIHLRNELTDEFRTPKTNKNTAYDRKTNT